MPAKTLSAVAQLGGDLVGEAAGHQRGVGLASGVADLVGVGGERVGDAGQLGDLDPVGAVAGEGGVDRDPYQLGDDLDLP